MKGAVLNVLVAVLALYAVLLSAVRRGE